jgi:hypothetical protein
MDKLEERLVAQTVIRHGEPVTLIIDGKEVTGNTGDIVQTRNPDGREALDEITRLKADNERMLKAFNAAVDQAGMYAALVAELAEGLEDACDMICADDDDPEGSSLRGVLQRARNLINKAKGLKP